MKKIASKKRAWKVVLGFIPFLLVCFFLAFSSFTTSRLVDDFLKQLGISKTGADEKITNSILGGSIDLYGIKNAKNIALGNRKAVTIDLLTYIKQQVNSAGFIKQYQAMKNSHKPTESIAETPEQMRAATIGRHKAGIAELEASIKKADANTKTILENVLADAKKQLKDAEDPNNKQFLRYSKNYEGLVKTFKESYESQLAQWEKKYPTNHLLYVKMRLQEFMEETKDIDFSAELVAKNGKKIFVRPEYERKGNRWKMAFRAGREVVEPAREFVQKWIDEIK